MLSPEARYEAGIFNNEEKYELAGMLKGMVSSLFVCFQIKSHDF